MTFEGVVEIAAAKRRAAPLPCTWAPDECPSPTMCRAAGACVDAYVKQRLGIAQGDTDGNRGWPE
jgi:hypothetical protein